jgi:hypothetical protein
MSAENRICPTRNSLTAALPVNIVQRHSASAILWLSSFSLSFAPVRIHSWSTGGSSPLVVRVRLQAQRRLTGSTEPHAEAGLSTSTPHVISEQMALMQSGGVLSDGSGRGVTPAVHASRSIRTFTDGGTVGTRCLQTGVATPLTAARRTGAPAAARCTLCPRTRGGEQLQHEPQGLAYVSGATHGCGPA